MCMDVSARADEMSLRGPCILQGVIRKHLRDPDLIKEPNESRVTSLTAAHKSHLAISVLGRACIHIRSSGLGGPVKKPLSQAEWTVLLEGGSWLLGS